MFSTEHIVLRKTVWLHQYDQSGNFKTCRLPFSIPSANVGYRSHCGCGPGPCVLYGILYLQEMLQQGQEAQESTREERRTGPKEEGQRWRRRRGRRKEGEERWGGHWIPCPPEVFLDHFHCITAESNLLHLSTHVRSKWFTGLKCKETLNYC